MPEDPFFDEPFEDDGITLGPEEALQREIEKSKSLKVDRLRLQDEIEKLRSQIASLAEENRNLKLKIENLHRQNPPPSPEPDQTPTQTILPAGWPFFLLIFNLLAVGFLLIFLLMR